MRGIERNGKRGLTPRVDEVEHGVNVSDLVVVEVHYGELSTLKKPGKITFPQESTARG